MAFAIVISRLLLAGVLPLLAGCGPDTPAGRNVERSAAATQKRSLAKRIVSLDYCADQFLLELAGRDRILALSPDAERPFSYLRKKAAGVRTVRPVAEAIVALKPDLVIRSYGGGPLMRSALERLNIPVVEVGWANSLKDIEANLERLGAALGAQEQAQKTIETMRARLEAIVLPTVGASALYMTPTGVTTGPGTLIHELLTSAGVANFAERPGWHPLPLERLAYEQPDLVVAAFFDSSTNHTQHWSASRHDFVDRRLGSQPRVMLSGAWTACGGWFLLDAIEALAAAR